MAFAVETDSSVGREAANMVLSKAFEIFATQIMSMVGLHLLVPFRNTGTPYGNSGMKFTTRGDRRDLTARQRRAELL